MVLTACDNYVSTYSSSQTEGQKILKCFEEKDKKTLKENVAALISWGVLPAVRFSYSA